MSILSAPVPSWLAVVAISPLCFWALVEIRNAFTHK